MSEKTGESMTELYDRVSKGEVAVSEITEAMEQATSAGGQFYKGMEKASQTTQGLISTLKDNAQALVGEVFQPISESLTEEVLPGAIEAIDTLTTAFRENGINGMITAAGEIIANFLTSLAEQLPSIVESAVQLVMSLVNGIRENLPAITQAAGDTIMSFIQGAAQLIPELAGVALDMIISFGYYILENLPTIIETAITLMSNFVEAIAERIPELIPLALKIMVTLYTEIIKSIPKVVESALKVGKSVVQGIWDGIKAAWSQLVEWFNNLWDSLFKRKTVDVKVRGTTVDDTDGSHASGLNYVPFDGYIAELHKGEMVLPRREANALREGYGGVTVIQNIYSQAKTAADLMREARYEQERAVLMGV